MDTLYWSPDLKVKKENLIILYLKNKTQLDPLVAEIERYLKLNFQVEIIIYGKFERKDFKNYLNKAKYLVAITAGSETQGLVWAEAWSMDVPTFIYNNTVDIVRGKKIDSSSAPYINNENGAFFSNLVELEKIIASQRTFLPRKWVIDNMSDTASARKLINLISNFNVN